MGVLYSVFVGLVVLTTGLVASAFGAWYYALETYADQMSDLGHVLMKFALPPFILLLASPVADAALWAVWGFEFPVVGFPGTVAGLVGTGATLGYVVVDVRESVHDAPATA